LSRRVKYEPIATPAAAADWSVSISSTDAVRVISISGQLVTSATVANRIPGLKITSQDNVAVYRGVSNVAQAASLTDFWTWDCNMSGPGYAGLYAASASINVNPMPDLWLPYQWKISVTTFGLSAGDQWSGLYVTYEDPFDPSPSQVRAYLAES
jgi:hypothetical protein